MLIVIFSILNNSYYNAEQNSCLPLWFKLISDSGGFNAYDYRLLGTYSFLNILQNMLSNNAFITAIQANSGGRVGATYVQCSNSLFSNFGVEFQQSYANYLPNILQQYKVIVYNGQFDIRCSTVGTSEWLRLLPWSGSHYFNYMPFTQFIANGIVAGLFKTYLNLTQLVVYGAGHLSPLDQPQSTLTMFTRFISANSLNVSCPAEPCLPIECPNLCSGRGSCSSSKCICNYPYTGDDCSIITRNSYQLFGVSESFSGTLYGQSPHIYQLQIDQLLNIGNTTTTNSLGYFDLQISINKLSNFGQIYIYVGGGQNFITPDLSSQDALMQQFPFYNLEDISFKQLSVNDLPRNVYQKITIVIMNALDTTATYNFGYLTQVSGPTTSAITLILSTVLAFTIFLAIILGLIILIQIMFGVGIDKKTLSYLTE